MKRIKFLFVFVYLVLPLFSKSFKPNVCFYDTIDYELIKKPTYSLDLPPEEKWEEFNKKKQKFTSELAQCIIKKCPAELSYIVDTLTIGIVINSKGLIDTTFLAKSYCYPFTDILNFIKRYDFGNQLVEYYTENKANYAFLIKVDIWVDWKNKKLFLLFEPLRKWEDL